MKMYSLLALALVVQLLAFSTGGAPKTSPQPSPSSAPQQSPSPQRPAPTDDEDVVRITTKLVQVDAVVTDKNGKLVTDLLPEEVRIFEDGRSQKIMIVADLLADQKHRLATQWIDFEIVK